MTNSEATFHAMMTKYFAFHDIKALWPLVQELYAEMLEEQKENAK